ncbi:DUF1592 domain-containing protein [Stieleria sp. TO1_6]|uniref:DUF1592 domain-containing protein n=1 Tax=Stieleria tagensis TaxID=2956795 RepID=UPI00209A8899|nr:DUF1592 domain-containing protein [Stieleria tagensis]MCO8122144.1 DUF1592 domain-containing protein [Stieleria tagensis]
MLRPILSFTCVFIASTVAADPISSADFAKAQSFVQSYCVSCHGPDAEEGDRQFDSLIGTELDGDSIEAWHEILDRVNLADMPPEDAPKRPSDAERLEVSEMLTQLLSQVRQADAKPQTVLRRLNRLEYDSAMRKVLALDNMLFDPSSEFVPDEKYHEYRNLGQTLVLSDVLMSQYLTASGQYLDRAISKRQKSPPRQKLTFKAPFYKTNNGQADGLDRPGEYQHLRENPTYQNGYLWIKKLHQGVQTSGYYTIRVKANAINRDHPYLDWILDVPKQDPLQLGVVATSASAKDFDTNDASDQSLDVFTLPDDEPQWFETVAWIDKGYSIRFTFPNGPLKIKNMRHSLMHKHRDLFPGFIRDRVHVFHTMHPDYDKVEGAKLAKEFLAEQERLKLAGKPYDVFGVDHSIHTRAAWSQFYSEYQGPRIRVHEIELIGPVSRMSPEEKAVAQFFPDKKPFAEDAKNLIGRFARRAFRHPVDPDEVQPFIDFYNTQALEGVDHIEALKLVYQAVLCSPSFLYHRTREGLLDDHDLATRLSFFLWSEPPDAELRTLAVQGRLRDPEILRQQTDRLLADPRHMEMVRPFVDAWLRLAKLGTMLPDRVEHPEYFNERLEEAMRTETQMFIADMIRRDVGVSALIDSDYSFLNASLARLYGIDGVEGHEFRRVKFNNRVRGGLLGQAAVLTASANGIDTSPVLRGVWVLECLLGTPPSPPPPDIEPIEPDTRGATTIRQQLAKHRDVATCANCHKRIDPPGFALESFDEIGRYRERYLLDGPWKRPGPVVDPSGELPSGQAFENIISLKQLLLPKLDLVTRNVATNLLTHASGRLDDPSDRADVLKLMQALPPNPSVTAEDAYRRPYGVGLRSLIHAVVQSDAFRR